MNKVLNKYLLTLVSCFLICTSFARPTPPSPDNIGRPGPAPGLPLDENLGLFLFLILFFGIYKIYSFNKSKKASI